ncbi:hypothetical protein PC129_g12456 [Phytophthora cactorum]|uniref:Uncharacterized protein n=1 Tax=Phytophthora cactorum TaxID=29920 RepID=A0A329RXN6_9STRA|nr:hypothetical protein Pcac1_g12717 [Phytophthora cactorum]KAG2814612.1 hypothetical protein PC112_g14248 [Phytophthora cactorum]KAG2818898.1 hypothetical protein PC111_g12109 [Phytophthora cactorum]KAG2857131.1 hypothetical protein PC113_g10955 [Phytophthora cactorum]KAG2895412.1 hypothetical protein PC114_g15483 [Phytophthora cactorum]
MSFQDLAPENTKRALSTAISTFEQFLAKENVTSEFVRASILADSRGIAFVKLMDRFAMFLAFSTGKGGELRKRNTVMSYYRNVKNWPLERYPQHRIAIEQQLLKMGRILERHFLLRHRGGVVEKAPACTKNDLRSLVDGLYYDAVGETEDQDAALLVVMWYAFGRASDLTFIPMRNLSKASEEQGLSLFPDKDSFITCPVNAITMALAMQSFPVASLVHVAMLSDNHETESSSSSAPYAA